MTDNSNNNNGSLLKASLAFTPVGIGTALAAKKVYKDGAHIPSTKSSMVSSVKDLTPSSEPRIPNAKEIKEFMRKGVVGRPVHGEVAKQAWEWAMIGINSSTREGLLNYTRDIQRMDGAQSLTAIEMTMQNNKSNIMGNVWNRFQRNVGMLEEQRNLFGILPKFSPVEIDTVTESFRGNIPSFIQNRFSSIAKSLGSNLQDISGITRPELAKDGFAMFYTTFKTSLGDLRIGVPSVKDGLLFEGGTLQTKRIAPDVLIVNKEGVQRLNRSEFFLKEIEESIIPDIGTRIKTQYGLKKAIKQAKQSIFGELQSVPALDPNMRTSAQIQYENIRGKSIDIKYQQEARKLYSDSPEFASMYREPTERELSSLITSKAGRELGLTGGVGPTAMSKGRLSTEVWEKYDITGGPVDYSRRPEQAYRKFQLTEQATEFINKHSRLSKYRAYEVQAQKLSESNSLGPNLKALYVNPESKAFALGGSAEVLEKIGMGEGEALIRKDIASNLSFESIETTKLKFTRDDLVESGFKNILPGEILGVSERGIPFRYEEGMDIKDLRKFNSPGLGEYASLSYKQRYEFVHGTKLFGGAKAVTQVRKEKEFKAAIRELTGRDIGTDIIINMDELKKNKSLHRRQMLTSLSEITAENMNIQSNKRAIKALQQRNIADIGSGLVRSATKNGIYNHNKFTENLMRFSTKTLGINPEQFGDVFGAVPLVSGEEESSNMLSKILLKENKMDIDKYARYRSSFFSGTAGGSTSLSFGGPANDVGGLGSLEPRAFEILGQPQFGQTGKDLSKEFLERMQITQPEAMKMHRELGYTLESMTGKSIANKPTKEFIASQGYSSKKIQSMMEEGSFLIKPGKGQRDIYVPSARALDDTALGGLQSFEISNNKATKSHIGQMYHDMAFKASQFANNKITASTYEKDISILGDRLRREWAPFGKGAGSISRGKMIGSKFLRGMTATREGAKTVIREADTIGISKNAFNQMSKDMIKGGYEKKDMLALQQKFEAGGKVGGMIWRHPQIGGYSMQYTNIKMAEGAQPTDVLLPELGANIRATTKSGIEVEKRVTLGPLVGLAGDKDADAYAVALVSPDREKEITKMLSTTDNEFTRRYTEHQVRMQLFKSKPASDAGLTSIAKMSGDIEKLAAGQKWIGSLSSQLSVAKEALSANGKGAPAADARSLLEWLEQTPISAKHLSAKEASQGGLSSLMETISSGIETRNQTRVTEAVRTIVSSNAMSSEMLTGNVTLTEGADQISRIMNVNINKNIRGVNINSAVKELMRSMSDHQANGSTRAYERLSGKGSRISIAEIPEMLSRGASNLTSVNNGTFAKIAISMSTANNTLGKVGRSIIKNHKPLSLGFAASIALAATLSSPKDTIGPGNNLIPNGKLNMRPGKAANRISPETMLPPSKSMGSPTAPNMLSSSQARISSGTPGRRMHIQAQVNSSVNIAQITGQAAILGSRSSVNLRDSRSKLLPHEIINKVL